MDDQAPEGTDPATEAWVRGLLGEVGDAPESLPPEVAARLDDVLAGLAQERTPARPAVVPLDSGRRRRHRLQLLAAAAVVVVGGYAVTTSGVLIGGAADDAGSGGATTSDASGEGAPAEAPRTGAYPLTSGSLRSDARGLVEAPAGAYVLPGEALPATGDEARTNGDLAAPSPAPSPAPGPTPSPAPGAGGGPAEGAPPTTGACLDPPVPADLLRLAVTYDGRAATAVLRPLDGGRSPRVRVEVWDCGAPLRLAAVVVRR